MKLAIIGGGISGIICAIEASKNNDVTVFERNSSTLKKLLLTGNGKCNYYNDNQDLSNYNSSNKKLINKIINKENLDKVLKFYDHIGIIPKIKNGYYYPISNTAFSMKEALLNEIKLNNVKIVTDCLINDIKKEDNKFIINNEEFDAIVISTGSKASPKTGSDGIGYEILKKFNHTIIKPLPALVQLKGNEKYFKDWSGLRCDVKVSLYENNKFIKEEIGEIQLTNYGVSGICIFNLSSIVSRGLDENKREDIFINFLPYISDIESFIIERNNKLKNRNIMELLEGLLHYKLVKILLKLSNIKEDELFSNIDSDKKKILFDNLTKFKLNIKETNDFNSSQVCSGGIPLTEINLNTMESLKEKNLYIIGELLDVDGLCGGYNITFATITALLAGASIGD